MLRSLLIIDDTYQVMQKAYYSIKRTLFYHNGPYYYVELPNGYIVNDAALLCVFRSWRSVKLDIESVTVSTSFGLGGNFFIYKTYLM